GASLARRRGSQSHPRPPPCPRWVRPAQFAGEAPRRSPPETAEPTTQASTAWRGRFSYRSDWLKQILHSRSDQKSFSYVLIPTGCWFVRILKRAAAAVNCASDSTAP